MKKAIGRAGFASALAMAALAAPLAGSAIAAPGGLNPGDGNYCYSQSSGCTAGWQADVAGEYGGVTSGSYEVDQWEQVGVDLNGNPVFAWVKIAGGGAGPFAAAPGSLVAGNLYQLVIKGQGGGAIGSVTGTGTA